MYFEPFLEKVLIRNQNNLVYKTPDRFFFLSNNAEFYADIKTVEKMAKSFHEKRSQQKSGRNKKVIISFYK